MHTKIGYFETEGRYHVGDGTTCIVGRSPVMLQLYDHIDRLARVPTTVLITGETGTGKGLLARAIHYHEENPRKKSPFLSVPTLNVNEGVLESELFGHTRGAFTSAVRTRHGYFEAARGGTIFLDEISEMSLAMQGKLLYTIQERAIIPVGSSSSRKVDARVIAATNKDIAKMVEEGRFREDLYYRLNVFPLHTPPLRERKEDIPLIVQYLVEEYSPRLSKNITRVSVFALEKLRHHDWPGNVRELENVIERAMLLRGTGEIQSEDIHLDGQSDNPYDQLRGNGAVEPLAQVLDRVERAYIIYALEHRSGNLNDVAEQLGLHRKTFWQMRKKHGLMVDENDETPLPNSTPDIRDKAGMNG